MRTLASLPIELTGEPLTLEFDLDVDRAEWGTTSASALRRSRAGRAGRRARGRRRRRRRLSRTATTCSMAWEFGGWETPNPAERSTHRMRATLLPAHGRMRLEERGSHPSEHAPPARAPDRPGPHTLLLLRTPGNPDFVDPADPRPDPPDRPARRAPGRRSPRPLSPARTSPARWSSGRWQAALDRRRRRPPRLRLWRAVALAELGRSTEAIAAFASLDPRRPAAPPTAAQLLRTRLTTFAPLLRAALGPRYAGAAARVAAERARIRRRRARRPAAHRDRWTSRDSARRQRRRGAHDDGRPPGDPRRRVELGPASSRRPRPTSRPRPSLYDAMVGGEGGGARPPTWRRSSCGGPRSPRVAGASTTPSPRPSARSIQRHRPRMDGRAPADLTGARALACRTALARPARLVPLTRRLTEGIAVFAAGLAPGCRCAGAPACAQPPTAASTRSRSHT
jgi:hypothetical protein